MKNILNCSLIMALILSPVTASAQSSIVTQKFTPVYEGVISRQIAILEVAYPETATNFMKLFPDAVNPLWLKEENTLFVYFLNAGKKVTAVFSCKGPMKYSIAVIDVAAIPAPILHKIKIGHPSFSFCSGKQIHAGGYTAFELVIENSNEYIAISTTDEDEIIITGRVRKTNSY